MSVSRREDRVLLAHGSGGRLSHELVERLFLRHFHNPMLGELGDAATVLFSQLGFGALSASVFSTTERGMATICPRLAFTTDSYVISPIFFPGGDIGKLAVCGTVNDLAVSGAVPLYLSAGFILEEGLELAELERIVASMAETARHANVQIVAGDTKVVDHGKADRIFINTAGLGVIPGGVELSARRVQPGDSVIVSGTLGDHGITIMSQREGLRFDVPLVSDCAPLNGLIAAVLDALISTEMVAALHCMRDPTRGGLATALNEIAVQGQVGIEIEEQQLPVRNAVQAVCELLGLDPLYVANEGKLVAFVAPEAEAIVLEAMRRHPYGQEAVRIGQVTGTHVGRVVMRTRLGARRIVEMPAGEQLPRIC